MQAVGGQRHSKKFSVDRLFEVGRRRIRRSSMSSDADDVFAPPDVQLNGDDDDDASSTWSMGSEQPSEASTDGGATPYEARSDLRSSGARSTASQSSVDRRSPRKDRTARERRRHVDRGYSLMNGDEQPYKYQKRTVCTHFAV